CARSIASWDKSGGKLLDPVMYTTWLRPCPGSKQFGSLDTPPSPLPPASALPPASPPTSAASARTLGSSASLGGPPAAPASLRPASTIEPASGGKSTSDASASARSQTPCAQESNMKHCAVLH